jgi:DNA-binding IclR family transcriptional regulator
MLVSLTRGGYVERDEASPRYRLGSRLVEFAGLRLQQTLIRANAHPILEQLVQETGETAFIGAVDGNRAVYIDRAESQHRLRVVGEIGAPVPLHATALGKALLAQMSPDRIRAVLESPLRAYSRHTIVDPKRLAAQLDEIRARGVALSHGERDEFTVGVAAPVHGYPGMVVTAITVAGMIGRLDLEASTSAIRAAATQLSTALSAHIGPDE